MQGQGGRGVVVAGAGGGELLEGGAGEECGGEGGGQAGVGGRRGKASGGLPGGAPNADGYTTSPPTTEPGLIHDTPPSWAGPP